MVTISSTTNSVIFTFDDNQHYLQNGTIEVPKNALALVVDDSDMVTFKKASSNDIFLSITLEELDMTKEEVISYYQANMVGAEGITSGEVQTMIDESISGKADSSAVTEEISAAVSGKADSSAVTEEISAAVSGKADSSAVTEEISAAVSGKADSSAVTQEITAAVSGKADSSAVTEEISAAVSGKADSSAVTEEISAAVSGKADTSALTVYFDDAVYEMSGQTHVINFYNGNVIKATINADDFIKDGMVDDVVVENGYLVITFNTDSGKQPISIPLTDIFDPSNYYTTGQTDSAITAAVSGKADSSTVETLSGTVTAHTADTTIHVTSADKTSWNAKLDSSALAPYYTSAQTDSAITAAVSGKADSSTVQTLSGQVIDDELVIVNGFLNVNAQLATKANASDLGGVKIVALSQQAYDNLNPKDPNTLYIINS